MVFPLVTYDPSDTKAIKDLARNEFDEKTPTLELEEFSQQRTLVLTSPAIAWRGTKEPPSEVFKRLNEILELEWSARERDEGRLISLEEIGEHFASTVADRYRGVGWRVNDYVDNYECRYLRFMPGIW